MKKAVRIGSDTDHLLNETEHNIKFGLFTIALMFFQSSKLVKRDKKSLAGQRNLLDDEVKKKDKEYKSKERMKLDEARRNRERRKLLMKHANELAEIGLNRRLKREVREVLDGSAKHIHTCPALCLGKRARRQIAKTT